MRNILLCLLFLGTFAKGISSGNEPSQGSESQELTLRQDKGFGPEVKVESPENVAAILKIAEEAHKSAAEAHNRAAAILKIVAEDPGMLQKNSLSQDSLPAVKGLFQGNSQESALPAAAQSNSSQVYSEYPKESFPVDYGNFRQEGYTYPQQAYGDYSQQYPPCPQSCCPPPCCPQVCCPQPCCCPPPCCPPPKCPCPRFAVSADFLYMLSSTDQPFFVQDDDANAPNPFGKRFANRQGWHYGYHVDIRNFYPCGQGDFLRARFTNFPCFTDSRTINFPAGDSFSPILNHPLFPATISPGTARMRHRLQFYEAELLWGRPIYCCRRLLLELEFGVQWTKVNSDEHVRYEDPDIGFIARIRNKSSFQGVGPEIALDYSYCFCKCLSIAGRSTFALLANKRTARFQETFITTLSTELFDSDNDKFWFGTPFFDARLGIRAHSCFSFCGCQEHRFTVEAGYEIIHMVKAIDRIYFVDNVNTGSSFVQHRDFTLHGPYLYGQICF